MKRTITEQIRTIESYYKRTDEKLTLLTDGFLEKHINVRTYSANTLPEFITYYVVNSGSKIEVNLDKKQIRFTLREW